jgi:hypothetical protein
MKRVASVDIGSFVLYGAVLVAFAARELIDRVWVKATSSAPPHTASVERWKPTTEAPAAVPPRFLTEFEAERLLPGLIVVVVVDNAVTLKSTGAWRVTVRVLVAAAGGTALAVTTTEKVRVPVSVGAVVQEKTPVVGFIDAPAGAPDKLKVSWLAGTSASVAEAVKVRVAPAETVLLLIVARTGVWLVSATTTSNVSSADWAGLPLSVTLSVML